MNTLEPTKSAFRTTEIVPGPAASTRRPLARLGVHVYPSPFEHETRILKITKALVEQSIVQRVLIIAMAKPGLPEQEAIDGAREVWRVHTVLSGGALWSKALRFFEWSARVFSRLRGQQVDVINCHSLSGLPLCVALKWWHRCVLVYQPHELETETATARGGRKAVAKWLERKLIPYADRVIVVSNSIADHYRRSYGLSDVPVIFNVPEIEQAGEGTRNRLLRDRFDIPDGHLVFMYQGVLDAVRGVRLLLDAFRRISGPHHIVFLGFGELEDEIRVAAAASPNIHFHAAVSPESVLRYTRGADVGFALLSDDCLNHSFALPNKFFHYLHAGMPVIVSDLPEMGILVDSYGCGWRVTNDVASLAALISGLDSVGLESRIAGALRVRHDFHWGREEVKLAAAYRPLFATANEC